MMAAAGHTRPTEIPIKPPLGPEPAIQVEDRTMARTTRVMVQTKRNSAT
jgi:hypothetical protein